MEPFKRYFDTGVFAAPNVVPPIVAELFRRWVLPGQAQDHALRIGVRDGYLNLYVGGQSVANIEASRRDGVRVSIHKKYANGICKPEKGELTDMVASDDRGGSTMVTLRGEELNRPRPADIVELWIATAATYCGDEKRFVEDLVAANPNVVDLEMALPGDCRLLNDTGKKAAPRMDLVTVVEDAGGKPRLNFWEAKCAVNGELRANSEIDIKAKSGARVARQLHRYVQWMELDGREAEVVAAFQEKRAAVFG